MRVKDRSTPQPLSVDEEYGRFFDGYYNLGRPGEILERSVVLSRPKGVKERALGNPQAAAAPKVSQAARGGRVGGTPHAR